MVFMCISVVHERQGECFMSTETVSSTEDFSHLPPPISITEPALRRIKKIMQEEGEGMFLRIFVQGGGCSGFQYGFTMDNQKNEGDTFIEQDGVGVLIDPMSFQYLVGAEIQYVSDLSGEQFVIKNPNATNTCGCGSSFSAG